MKLRICCACMNNLVAEPGDRHCPDCRAAHDRAAPPPPALTDDLLRAHGIDPAAVAAGGYLNP
jgi:hypothetical protein